MRNGVHSVARLTSIEFVEDIVDSWWIVTPSSIWASQY
jgi:hypothetical protein